MEPFEKIELADIEQRGESFPLQEQATGAALSLSTSYPQGKSPVLIGKERPAADIFTERAADAVSGTPSPSFIP
jgi:hypothetical protein